MNRSHIQSHHAQVVEALGGHTPRYPQQTMYQEDHTSQINAPRRNPRSNFRDRSNRRKTTGFEEIRQEYFNIHQNKARAEPAGETHIQVHQTAVDDSQDLFPKPSAFIRAPRRHIPPRRQRPATMEDDELVGGTGVVNRGSKAADMFQRRRERTDQLIREQENATPTPAAHQTQGRQTIMLTQASWDGQPTPPQQQRRVQPNATAAQPRRAPPPQSRPHHQQQQQQYQQQQQPSQPQQHQQHHQQQRRPQQSHGHTAVDSRRSRQPLTPKSPRFEMNSPWNDPNMPVGNRFHPNVVPYRDSYNVSPKGWGRGTSNFGEDNNVKEHYEYTSTSEKFRFTPAPRINKIGAIMSTSSEENYNSRPKSWCDTEPTASRHQHAPPPTRKAYPQHRQHNQSSGKQFAGRSRWGYGESDAL